MEQKSTNTPNKTKQNKAKKKPGRPRKIVKPKPTIVIKKLGTKSLLLTMLITDKVVSVPGC